MSAPVVTIFKNGDNHFQGKRLVVNRKEIRNFEALLDKITKDTRSQIAVRSLRTPNHGHKVEDMEKLENGGVYVAVGPERFKKLRYNEIRALPSNKHRLEAQSVKPVVHSRVIVSGRARKVAAAEPLSNRIIQVYRNGDDRHPGLKILLDKRILKSMDNVLQYISDKVNLRTGAVRSLFTLDGVELQNAKQIESGQKYVAVGFGKKFLRMHYNDGGSLSVTPRRAATKNSYSPDRSLKRIKARRLKTHPQDKQTIKRENKIQSSSESESPEKFQSMRNRAESNKSSDGPSPPSVSDNDDMSPTDKIGRSRENSTSENVSGSPEKSSPFHSSAKKEETFDMTGSTNDVDSAEVANAEDNGIESGTGDNIFKATGNQGEKATAVRDNDETQTEKPLDLQQAEEVDEEIEDETTQDNQNNGEETAVKTEESLEVKNETPVTTQKQNEDAVKESQSSQPAGNI